MESRSSALAGRFFNMNPPGKAPDVRDPWKGYEKAKEQPEFRRTDIISFEEKLKEFELGSWKIEGKNLG